MADQQTSHPVQPASGFTSIGNELDPTAPLWRVYRDEVRSHDQTVTFDEWNKTLDILLIFAGLFSAVVTSFLVASYPLLDPQDENETVINAIYALALAINSSITLPTPTPSDPVTASALWVNGLWFTSLFLALAVAFFAILAKQWLVEYNHRMADPPAAVTASSPTHPNSAAHLPPAHSPSAPGASNDVPSQPTAHLDALSPTASLAWARRRQFFFAAFAEWHIPVLITQVLPLLLHVALFFFLVGLSAFVWTLNRHIARVVTVLTVLLFCLYWIATLLPVFRADCPTATPLVRRAREAPTWIAISAVRLWRLILPVVRRAFHPSRVPSFDADRVMTDLRRRQKRVRNSGWHEGGLTTDEEVKLDTLQWLILVSGSETAIAAAFQALGALPPESKFIPSLRTITAGMDTALEHLGNSLVPPTAVEIIRAVRSELTLGRGSWGLPLLGLDLSSLFTETLRDSKHPDARLLSVAMRLNGQYYTHHDGKTRWSFSSLYDIADSLIRGDLSSESCQSAARFLLDRPSISWSAFTYLSVILGVRSLHGTRSLYLDDSEKALIFRIFNFVRGNEPCKVYDAPHICNGLCIVFFMVCKLDMEDPASCRIVPIILSQLLPCLMPELQGDAEDRVPLSMSRNELFSWAVYRSDWLHAPWPAEDTSIGALSNLLSRFDWSWPHRDAQLRILEWFLSRGWYGALLSSGLMAKLDDTRTCDPQVRNWMLRNFVDIVRKIKLVRTSWAQGAVRHFSDFQWIQSNPATYALCEFFSCLISLCRDLLSVLIDEASREVLFSMGLLPEIGACLVDMERIFLIENSLQERFLDMVVVAVSSVEHLQHAEKKGEYLLHLAQHCIVLDPCWTRSDKVTAHLDARLMEDMLVRVGPCTRCSEYAAPKWPDEFIDFVELRFLSVPQLSPTAFDLLLPSVSVSRPYEASWPTEPVTTNAVTVPPTESEPIPIPELDVTVLADIALSVELEPVLDPTATLDLPPCRSNDVLPPVSDSTPRLDLDLALGITTPLVIAPSLAMTPAPDATTKSAQIPLPATASDAAALVVDVALDRDLDPVSPMRGDLVGVSTWQPLHNCSPTISARRIDARPTPAAYATENLVVDAAVLSLTASAVHVSDAEFAACLPASAYGGVGVHPEAPSSGVLEHDDPDTHAPRHGSMESLSSAVSSRADNTASAVPVRPTSPDAAAVLSCECALNVPTATSQSSIESIRDAAAAASVLSSSPLAVPSLSNQVEDIPGVEAHASSAG